ncbi:hypothetical protein BH18CHL1_BH18CHL1_06270 [soil metagenome]
MAIIPPMERLLRERDRLRPARLDLLLIVILVALGSGTALLIVDPSLDWVLFDASLDVAVNSISTLAFGGLAVLAIARYRESGRLSSLFQGSGLFLLAIGGGANVALVLLRADGRVGLALGLPQQFPVYTATIVRLVAAALFMIGAAAAVRALNGRPAAARRLVLAPPITIGLLAVILYSIRDVLPPLIGDAGIEALLIAEPRFARPLPGSSPLLVSAGGLTVGFLLAATLLYRFAYVRHGPVVEGFLAAGLLIAAFAEIHATLYPGVYTGLVTTSDALRLGFLSVLLLGLDAEARADLRALRAAYATLDELRVTEAERVALEERARLAREIHDGLAQHLWFAKLKHERLSRLVPEGAEALSTEVGQALDAAIVEARQALVTMRTGVDHSLPLADLIARTVDDFGQRSGLRAESVSEDLPANIPARQQAELLRVVQEALTNVGKHADATMVRVHASIEGGELVITVTDNGRGFDPVAVREEGLGLRGMEERARLMGGQVGVSSELSDGTRVSVRLPLAPGASTSSIGPTAT